MLDICINISFFIFAPGAKIIAAPVLGAGVLAAGAVILVLAGTFVLPCLLPKFAYKRYQFRKQRRLRREQHATLRARLEALGLQGEFDFNLKLILSCKYLY